MFADLVVVIGPELCEDVVEGRDCRARRDEEEPVRSGSERDGVGIDWNVKSLDAWSGRQ